MISELEIRKSYLLSLALSGDARGQHWHLDGLTLLDEASEIPEMILLRK